MGRGFALIGVIIVVAIGGYLYTKQIQEVTPGGTTPQTTIETTAVRNDLLAIANAERRYFATNGKYASFDELRTNGDIQIPRRANYAYSAEVTSTGFEIIATYSGSDSNAPERLSMDETMTLKEN